MEGTYLWGPQWSYACLSKPYVALSCIYIDLGLVSGFGWWDVQFSSLTQSCLTLCNPMDCSTPGLPAHHQLPVFTQIHAHRVGDAIQPSCPLSSPSPPAFNLSQHQGLIQWVSSMHQVAKVLEFQLQHQSWWDVSKHNANRGLLSFMHWDASPWTLLLRT